MTYTSEQLLAPWKPRTFPREAKQAAFVLGGIGTGNVSLGSRGELRDWEIFNTPAKGKLLQNTYFTIWARQEGGEPVARVLESKLTPPLERGNGYHPMTGFGLPRLDHSVMHGEYPVVQIDFQDADLPVQVSLEAYTPFIPLNPDDSGIPGTIFTYHVTNPGQRLVDVTIAGSLSNPVGCLNANDFNYRIPSHACGNVNEYRDEPGMRGLYFTSNGIPVNELPYGNMALTTTNPHTTYKRAWLRGAWFDFLQEFWDDFATDGQLNDLGYDTPAADQRTDTGTLGVCEQLNPGETKIFRFFLSWYFPNRMNGWFEHVRDKREGKQITQNYYAAQYASAWAAAEYMVQNYERLHKETFSFRDALFSSTLPMDVIDAISSNITVIRSQTCFRLKDGRFLAFEGCRDSVGSCDGNCNHVWNYAQTLAFLFPTLEQSMRRTEFLEEVEPDGRMNFRARGLFHCAWEHKHAASDGQMGAIMRVYREWKLGADDEFLRALWPNMKKTLDYAYTEWDTDGDLVLDGAQHNTYDIEFNGPNPLSSFSFLGALKAAAEIADCLGDEEAKQKYGETYRISSAKVDELLWNGEYYVQRLEDVDRYKYQHGIGCLSDQLLAQQLAHLYGLGYLLPQDRVRSAIHSVFKFNFLADLRHHVNCQRVYAANEEKGLLLCSWPQGGRPRLPFVYSDEVWTGVEYQVAAHLIYEGLIEEGLTIVKAVRERYDGYARNPWNEVECGHHYARSLASWGLLIALSGYSFDMTRNEISFNPAVNRDDFSTFWSTGKAWGTYSQKTTASGDVDVKVNVLYGNAGGLIVKASGKEITL